MGHSSAIINCVANLSIINPLSICKCDMSANYIGRGCLSHLSNATMANVEVLSEIIDIINGFKSCQI